MHKKPHTRMLQLQLHITRILQPCAVWKGYIVLDKNGDKKIAQREAVIGFPGIRLRAPLR